MPEGPEVETIRASLAPLLVGRVIGAAWVSRKPLRSPLVARALTPLRGRVVVATGRRGKAMWIEVEGGAGLMVRLGMTGRLLVEPAAQEPVVHTHVRLGLGDTDELRFVDPRRFGSVVPFSHAAARAALLADVGPDAISWDDAGRDAAARALRATSRALKVALLDQRLLAGVGNIYASEALFRARLSPFALGTDLDEGAARRLLLAVEETLADAVRNRGTSFSDFVDARGARGDHRAHLQVYDRQGEACASCGGRIRSQTQGQRSTFWCPRCQPARRRVAAALR
ncbi:MAG: bifunctional DNA-formamidopyrimidine glycosylase/DNA-(apurinic or apyrimidinic site) lyase [Deltaproteobacteria bacterium]|nr:bifunctional DNA-formamidopyrimidine glycosylase/DNA-(apurinic or apyrimidinic site) lyase [Deltaproteobacteria bacterium]